MKISKMSNEQAADTLIRIAEPVSNICDDEELVKMLEDFSKMEDMGIIRAIGKLLPKLTAYALKKHRKDLFEIIGALDDKSLAEVEKMPFGETVKLVKDSYDDILKDFFTHSAVADQKTEKVSQD